MKKRKGESEEEFEARKNEIKQLINKFWDKREEIWGTVSIARAGLRRKKKEIKS